ncbi:N-acetylmuramoyl-L-alanine amidase [bacterium]|nr:N-acetylmuramoyl-L-alanine amidase [bacterium]
MSQRITFHWTAGNYLPNSLDKSDYHYLVAYDSQAGVAEVRKQHPTDQRLAHTYRRNTDNIGISMCAMIEASTNDYGAQPITALQVEAAAFVASQIALVKGVDLSLVRTHAEYAMDDGYFLDNADGVDVWGDPVRGDVRWDVILQASNGSAQELRAVAKASAEQLRERVSAYQAQFSDFDAAFAQVIKMGPIYRVRETGIEARQSDESFLRIGDVVRPFLI